jgi:hypothetical protein
MNIQLEKEEIALLAQLKQEYLSIRDGFGDIAIQRRQIETEIERIALVEERLIEQHKGNIAKQSLFMQQLENKYGRGMINIDTGIFEPSS